MTYERSTLRTDLVELLEKHTKQAKAAGDIDRARVIKDFSKKIVPDSTLEITPPRKGPIRL